MSGASEIPGTGKDEGKSPKTPREKKFIQVRLPFTAVDNKSTVSKSNQEKFKVVEEKNLKSVVNSNELTKDSTCADIIEIDETSKSVSSHEDSNESNSIPDTSLAEDEQNSELDTSQLSLESGKATLRVRKVAQQSDREKKRLERLKEKEEKEKKRAEEKAEKERIRKEKEEKEKKKAEEKAEKERIRKEKEEEKKKKEEEKELEKRRKEEEKKKKEEEKEAEKRRKEEDRKKKEEEKEIEKRKKEEEKKRKEEEKENEKKKKEEDEKRKKERLSQVFTNFFTTKKTTPAKDDSHSARNSVTLAFPPFQIKENMKLAPIVRTEFTLTRQEILDQALQKSSSSSVKTDLLLYKSNKGKKSGPTWPLNKDNDVEMIDEDEAPVNKDDIVTSFPTMPRRMRPKLLKFCENRRPAYWGTWGKTSHSVSPRRPFGKEAIFDYDVDSDDEWEEEVEPGESLTDSEGEGEGEEKEPADDYEVDNEFLVPHGYLSDEEGEKDEDERPLSPSAAKEQLKLKEEQFERELKEKTCHIKPSLIGCCWLDDLDREPQLLKVLQRYAAVVLTLSTPIKLNCNELVCESGESPMADDATRSEKASKRLVNENDIPALIRLLHGSSYSKITIVKEFQLYLERNRTEDNKNGPSKLQVLAKIAEIASWSKCTEAGTMNGRTCWLVNPEILDRYHLPDLSVINTWEYATETKKRGRKADDSRTEEDTPPAKTPRVSLIKKFAQPVNPSPRMSISLENNLHELGNNSVESTKQTITTPKAKKRIALISLPSSATKKPKTSNSESKNTPLTNFLKKMSSKETAKSSDCNDESLELDGVECLDVE